MGGKAFVRAGSAVFLVSLIVSCSDFKTGPSLPVGVRILGLRPTTGDSSRCCCHVIGIAGNPGELPIHVTITFGAYYPGQAEPFSKILYFIKELQPGEEHVIDAFGFRFSCSSIERVEIEDIDVNALWFPP